MREEGKTKQAAQRLKVELKVTVRGIIILERGTKKWKWEKWRSKKKKKGKRKDEGKMLEGRIKQLTLGWWICLSMLWPLQIIKMKARGLLYRVYTCHCGVYKKHHAHKSREFLHWILLLFLHPFDFLNFKKKNQFQKIKNQFWFIWFLTCKCKLKRTVGWSSNKNKNLLVHDSNLPLIL